MPDPISGIDLACKLAQEARTDLAKRILNANSGTDKIEPVTLTKQEGGPSRKDLQRAGFFIFDRASDSNTWSMRIGLWRPDWLDGADQHPPGLHALAGVNRRRMDPVQGDPVMAWPNEDCMPQYKSIGQRVAVRSALRCPAGGTLLVDLPTSAGKSRCAQALVRAFPRGLVVIAVPTTALCIDQEQALRDFDPSIDHPTAFYSGDVADRTAILRRLRDGTQRAIFASFWSPAWNPHWTT